MCDFCLSLLFFLSCSLSLSLFYLSFVLSLCRNLSPNCLSTPLCLISFCSPLALLLPFSLRQFLLPVLLLLEFMCLYFSVFLSSNLFCLVSLCLSCETKAALERRDEYREERLRDSTEERRQTESRGAEERAKDRLIGKRGKHLKERT